MKPILKDKQSVKSQGIMKSVNFGIKSSGLHHILGILRDQLYSDKILAFIREYSTNAADAHVEAGCPDRPIEVTFPNAMNPFFKVRDFGPALSEDEIQDVYAFYGESTKRNSNDVTGMLGIGSKSAFAYGDNFVINSFLDGTKYMYNAFIDPSQLGQISKIGEEPTDEENGIEIVIPIDEKDTQECRDKGHKLFRSFKVKPIIKGVEDFKYDDYETLFSGDGWKWLDVRNDRYSRGDATIAMGNIGYPVEPSDLNLSYEDDFRNLMTENLVLEMPIGDVEISASREKLQFTDYTRKNIISTLKRVQKEIADQIGEQFGQCKTLFDAKCLYGSTFRTDSPLYALREVVKKHLMWKGEVVDSSTFSTYKTAGVDLRKLTKSYRSSKYKPEEINTIHCEKNVVIIDNDLGHRRGIMGRLLPLKITQGKEPFVIQFDAYNDGDTVNRTAAQTKKQFLKDSKFDGKLVKLSSLPQHKLSEFGYGSQTSVKGEYTKDAKHSAKCFEFDFNNDCGRWHSKKSDFWKLAEVDVEESTGVYVIIDKFQVEKKTGKNDYGTLQDPTQISSLKEAIVSAGIDFPKNVYAFKVGQRKNVEGKDGWIELHKWAKGKLEALIQDQNLNQAWIDIQKVDAITGDGSYRSENREQMIKRFMGIRDSLADADGSMGTFLSQYKEMKHDDKTHALIKIVQGISNVYDVDFTCPKGVEPTHDLEAALTEVMDKYSMLNMIDSRKWNWGWNEDGEKSDENLLNYVNVIDVCNK